MKLPSPTVWKTLFRAHFPPNLSYFSIFTNIASSIAGYPNWEMDGAKVTLIDWEKRRNAMLDYQSFAIEQDSGDLELETASIENLLARVPKELGLKELTRLGYRRKYLLAVEISFESLVAIMNTKLLRQAELGEFLPAISDSLFVFNSAGKPYSYNITIAPVRKTELLRALEFNQQFHLNPRGKAKDYEKVAEAHPNTAMLIDVDFFQSEARIPLESIISFLTQGRHEMQRITTALAAYCFSAAPETT